MLSPRRSMVSTKLRSSIDVGRGGRSKPSSSRRWNGWTGSTTGGSWSPSATYRRPKLRSATTPCCNIQPWQPDSNQPASGKRGAVHALILERAEAAAPERNREMVALALSYVRLADLAEKNANADLVYETPATVTLPMQQQPQAEQQAQQAAKGKPSDGRE